MKATMILVGITLILSLSTIKADCVNVYKLEDGNCGELCLSKYISGFAIKFGGVKEGKCSDMGYTVLDHTEKVSVGPFGSFDVTIYTKPAELKFLEN